MKRKIYYWIYDKSNSIELASFLSEILYYISKLIYYIKSIFVKKDIIFMNHAEALKTVERIHQKPIGKKYIKNIPIDPSLDLSIIIPVYNVENYLEECMESVINQKTKYQYEIITINDGSRDNSSLILEKYKNNNVVNIINQENKGLSGARNTGIENSKGKYLMFIDSDDVVDENIVEELMNEAYKKDCEIVECGYYKFYPNGNKRYFINKNITTMSNNVEQFINYSGFACMKVFKRDLFNDIRFPESYWFEDTLIKFIIFRKCNNFSYIPKAFYKYRVHETSISHTSVGSPKSLDTYWILEYLTELSEELNIGDDVSLYKVLLNHLGVIFYLRTLKLDLEIRKAVFFLGCDLLMKYIPQRNYNLPNIYKELETSLIEKNYSKWELVCKYI